MATITPGAYSMLVLFLFQAYLLDSVGHVCAFFNLCFVVLAFGSIIIHPFLYSKSTQLLGADEYCVRDYTPACRSAATKRNLIENWNVSMLTLLGKYFAAFNLSSWTCKSCAVDIVLTTCCAWFRIRSSLCNGYGDETCHYRNWFTCRLIATKRWTFKLSASEIGWLLFRHFEYQWTSCIITHFEENISYTTMNFSCTFEYCTSYNNRKKKQWTKPNPTQHSHSYFFCCSSFFLLQTFAISMMLLMFFNFQTKTT